MHCIYPLIPAPSSLIFLVPAGPIATLLPISCTFLPTMPAFVRQTWDFSQNKTFLNSEMLIVKHNTKRQTMSAPFPLKIISYLLNSDNSRSKGVDQYRASCSACCFDSTSKDNFCWRSWYCLSPWAIFFSRSFPACSSFLRATFFINCRVKIRSVWYSLTTSVQKYPIPRHF